MRVLRPDEGYLLTEAADVPAAERTLTDEVYLGVTDSADNWKEIPISEAEALRAEAEEARKLAADSGQLTTDDPQVGLTETKPAEGEELSAAYTPQHPTEAGTKTDS